jgi:aryl-alcohol dehydrogenase-like predicted oxidoreductase
MEYVDLANTGIRASRVGLGTWAIGGWMWGGTDEAEAVRAIHAALDKGVTLIDTAPVYGQGRSEEIVGKALAESPRRSDVVLATKVGLQWSGPEEVWRNASPDRIRTEVEDSLRRLGVEAIDVYQVHWPDPQVPIGETARTLEALRSEGKIRAIGVSNYDVEQMDAHRQSAPLHVCQPPYNLFERAIEDDVLPYCRKHGISTLVYSSLCRGLLTGKIDSSRSFSGDDLRKNADPKFQSPRFEQYLEAVRSLQGYAKERWNKGVLHLAVRWLLEQPGVSVALWGARRPDQLDALAGVFELELNEDDREAIDRMIAESVTDPVGPEFMAPPAREQA